MIVKLKGFIEFCGDDYIDLDVNGVIFRVFISNKSIKKIFPSDSLVSIFVYEIIKENERLFFGFTQYEEREIFSDLLCVQGVGCLLYTSPSPRDATLSRMPSSA